MKRVVMISAALAVCAGVVIAQQGTSKQKSQQGRQVVSGTPEMQAWMEAMRLTENHNFFRPLAGSWNAQMTVFMDNGEKAQGQGTCAITGTFGGRYLTSTFNGTLQGRAYQGVQTFGYNNLKRQFESTWIDNMSTGIAFSSGNFDQNTRTFSMASEVDDAFTGERRVQTEETRIINDNQFSFTIFQTTSGGQRSKTLEIQYTRTGGQGLNPIDAEARMPAPGQPRGEK